MYVICISGKKFAGKDTLADYLIENHGATRISFADPLKDMVAKEYGVDRSSLDDPNRKEKPILDMPVDPQDDYSRMIAEFLYKEFRNERGGQPIEFGYPNGNFLGKNDDGYGWCQLYWNPRALAILKGSTNRSVRSNFWVQKAIEKAKNINGTAVISDLRYKSELGQIKEAFGEDVLFIRVRRFEKSLSTDPSECDLDDSKFDHYIDNTGTKEETFQQLEEILKNFKK